MTPKSGKKAVSVQVLNRREFTRKALRLGAVFSAGTLVLPGQVKSQILKPMIDGYCWSFWDRRMLDAISRIKRSDPRRMVGDTHLHTTRSDGKYTVRRIIARARFLNLDYLVITEHLTPRYYDVDCPLASMRDQIKAVRDMEDAGMKPPAVYPGVEISTSEGHVIGVFPRDYYRSKGFFSDFRSAFSVCGRRYMNASWAIGRVKALGGRTIIPHPGAKRRGKPFGVPLKSLETHLQGLPDGIEDRNTGNALFRQFGARFGLASVGASDDHFKALVGTSVTAYDGSRHDDLTHALARKATQALQTAPVSRALLKASLFYYSLRV